MERTANAVWWSSTVQKADSTNRMGFSGNWPSTYDIPAAGGSGTFEGARYTYCVSGAAMAGAWVVNADDVTVTHTTTGLTWHRSASVDQSMDWDTALEAADFTAMSLDYLNNYVRRTPMIAREENGNVERR